MDPQPMVSRLKVLLSSFHPAQLASLVAAFVLVVGIVAGSAWLVNAPTYALLFSDLDPETAADIVSRLKTSKIQYQLDEGGRAIRVPADRVDELRLELSAQGLPTSGRAGFELFDRTAFGATEFVEQVTYRRALEGELARTISTITEVSNARVHLSMGKDALFGESRPAKASVVLKLRGQRALANSTISGITNLVAASVEGLSPDAVVIIDTFGRSLARPTADDDAPGSAGNVERQQRLEREMGARVVALLEPVIGSERVRVNVALKLNPSTVEQTEERWDPETALRSRQVSADSTTTANPGGIAGARANTPPPAPDPKAPAPAAAPPAPLQALTVGGGASHTTEINNYEVSRTMVVTQRPPGDIARLSVAVIVDDDQVVKKGADGRNEMTRTPRTPEQLQKIQGLVAAAVGLEPERGDQIIVQNVSFEETPIDDPQPLTTFQQVQRYTPQIWEGARIVVVGIVALLAFFFFVRPMMRQLGGGAPARAGQSAAAALAGPGQPLRTVADLESEIEAQLDASTTPKLDARRLPVLARRVTAMSAKEPENVAKLLRSWINEGER